MSPIALPIVVPLVAAGLSMALMGRLRLQRILAFVASSATLAASVWLLLDVESSGTVVSVAGGWPAGPGIAVVADELAAILLVVAEIMLLGVLTFAVGQRETDRRAAFFHPVYHVLAAGVAMSFLTGDLFTLFVGFEVMLMASYVLLTVGACRPGIVDIRL